MNFQNTLGGHGHPMLELVGGAHYHITKRGPQPLEET